MPFKYDILANNKYMLQATPRLVVAVWPFKVKDGFDRLQLKSTNSDYMETEGPLFLDPMCVAAQTSSSKRSHVSQAKLTCLDPDDELHVRIANGDWMAVWMVNSPEDATKIREAILNNSSANDFRSGLKFLGRVFGISRSITVEPNSGAKNTRYLISGVGFGEFDTAIYFDPSLSMKQDFTVLFWARLNKGLDAMFDAGPLISVGEALPHLVDTFIGSGLNPAVNADSDLKRTPNTNIKVPTSVAMMLGRTVPDNNQSSVTYSSIMEAYYGVQSYGGRTGNHEWSGFIPDLKGSEKSTQHTLPVPLQGTLSPLVQPWAGVPMWSIWQQFLNRSINELYTCLRVDPRGSIVPTLVARQFPFTTDQFQAKFAVDGGAPTLSTTEEVININTGMKERRTKTTVLQGPPTNSQVIPIPCTRFTTLPRWKVDPKLVLQYSTSKANAMRLNYLQLKARTPNQAPIDLPLQRALWDPIADQADIERSGLYPYISTTNTLAPLVENAGLDDEGTAAGIKIWNHILADQMMGGHLKYSGSLQMRGIQEPICEGDNLEIDNLVYHIEGVSHSMWINGQGGGMSFTTTCHISNGVPADGSAAVPDTDMRESIRSTTEDSVAAGPAKNFFSTG